MDRPNSVRWLLKAVTATALAIGVCALITPMTRRIPPLPPLTKDDEAQPALNRYRQEPIPRIVLVGSSLARRLDEAYFLPLKVRNLALSGDSALTGLKIILSYSHLPSVVLIEANVLSRDIDASLVRRFSSTASDVSILRPVRTAIAYFNSTPNGSSQVSPVDELLRDPPRDYANALAIARAREEYSKPNLDDAIEKNSTILAQLVAQLTARGTRVYLFKMPYAPNVAETHYVEVTETAFHKTVPDPNCWLRLNYSTEQLRFEDHAHLDQRSALIVARALETEVLTKL